MQNVSKIHGILGGSSPGTGCYFAYSPLFEAIRRYSRTRMSRRFLIQGISYNRMRTRSQIIVNSHLRLRDGGEVVPVAIDLIHLELRGPVLGGPYAAVRVANEVLDAV